ncbi:unnamed protein product [Plutella xylostella]|uniref:(diamondback moth) hypothetical protein n=1 Tax=Plutella xylostella TaxID=51655 RepID=A0A8S4G577_PLUXY|nr:unnamed protein product [Plutella xylostella]
MKAMKSVDVKEEIAEVHTAARSPSPKRASKPKSRSRSGSRRMSNGPSGDSGSGGGGGDAPDTAQAQAETSDKSKARDNWIKCDQNESLDIELPIHDQIKQGILGFVEKEIQKADVTGAKPSFVFYSHDPSGLDEKFLKNLSRPSSGHKEKRSPSYRKKKRHSSRARERDLQEFEIPGSSLSALEKVDDYLKEYNHDEVVTLSGELEIEPNDVENNNGSSKDHRHKPRKTRRKGRDERQDTNANGRGVSPKVFKAALKSKPNAKPARPTELTTMLKSLEGSRTYHDTSIDNPFSSPSPLTSPNDDRMTPFSGRRPEKIYLQGGGTFRAVSRDRILSESQPPRDDDKYKHYNPYKLVFKPDYWRTTAGERPGMFTTPPPLRKMVQTRSAHEREKMALLEQSTQDGPSGLNVNVATSEKITTKNELKECEPPVRKVGSCMKMEIGCHKSSTSKKMSMASSKRSIEARKKQLELEAAEAIANINKKLIEKKLEADIAALEDCSKNSAASYSSVNVSQKVEQWLEHSHHDANDPPRPSTIPPPPGEPRHDAAALRSTVRGIAQSPPPPPRPPPPAQPPSDMQQLVQAMKDIAVAAATSTPHSQMLSRLSTPRDLPTFAGDPLEWLNFVQAYEESTEVCHFTPKENMWRLRKCLRGPARDSVTALLVTAAAPETVMGALQLQYGNPDVILPRIIQDLNRLHAVIKGKVNEPYATLTPLGWCLHGCVPHSPAGAACHSSLLVCCREPEEESECQRILRDMHDEVRRSFTIESMGVSQKPRQNSLDVQAVNHLDQNSVLLNGRWYVGLPWKTADANLPNSKPNAMKRLENVEKKMKVNEGFSLRYRERVQHLLDNDFAEELTCTRTSPRIWYLPHFGVDNPNKKN